MSWYLVIDGAVQPIPFKTMEEASAELDRIREKTSVINWDIISDSERKRYYSDQQVEGNSDIKVITFWLIIFLIYCFLKL